MSAQDGDDDDDPATVIGRGGVGPPGADRNAPPRPLDSATRRFEVPLASPTRAMPAGYGMAQFAPPPRPSAPRPAAGRPAAGRPAVPSMVDDPPSTTDMTLIELIDAELDAKTVQFNVPEGIDPSILDEPILDERMLDEPSGGGSELTIRMAVPEDLPSNLLDDTTDTRRAPPAAPSLSSMPTPALAMPAPSSPFAVPAHAPAEPGHQGPASSLAAAPRGSAPPAVRPEVAAAPAPGWVAGYIAVCAAIGLLGVAVLVWLRTERYW